MTLEEYKNLPRPKRKYFLLWKEDIVAIQEGSYMIPISEYVPPSLFGFKSDRHKCEFVKFKKWLCGRVMPPNRDNVKEVLDKNGFQFYDAWALATAAKGKLEGEDSYSIDWEEYYE